MMFSTKGPSITIVGTHGRNLSVYLKEHLEKKGIKSHAVGVYNRNTATIRRINNARTIICVNKEVYQVTEDSFDLADKKIICLDVSDSPQVKGTSKHLTGELWREYQENEVYPQLEKQIKKHIAKL